MIPNRPPYDRRSIIRGFLTFVAVPAAIAFVDATALAQAQDWSRLDPETAFAIERLREQLSAIDDWQCTSFKEQYRNALGTAIRDYVKDSTNPEISFRELKSSSYLKVLTTFRHEPTGDDYGLILAKARKQFLIAVEGTGGEPTNIIVPEGLLEILWVLGAVRPYLDRELTVAKLRRAKSDWMDSLLEEYAMDQRRIAKVRLICRQSAVVMLVLSQSGFQGINRWHSRLQEFDLIPNYQSYERLTSSNIDLVLQDYKPEPGQGYVPDPRGEWLADHSDVLAAEIVSFNEAFTTALAQTAPLRTFYRRLFSQPTLDLPASDVVLDPEAVFLRLKARPPRKTDIAGLDTRFPVDLFLCVPTHIQTGVPAAGDDQVKDTDYEPVMYEEIPLGVRVDEVRVDASDFEKGVWTLRQSPRTRKNNILLRDPQLLRQLASRLGLPDELSLEDFGVDIDNHFRTLTLTCRASLPGFKTRQKLSFTLDLTQRLTEDGLRSQVVAETLKHVQQGITRFLDEVTSDILIPGKHPLRIKNLATEGRWEDGTIGLTGAIDAGAFGTWNAKLSYVLLDEPTPEKPRLGYNGRWALRPAAVRCPPETRKLILAYLVAQIEAISRTIPSDSSLDVASLRDNLSQLTKHFSLGDLRFDSGNATIAGALRCPDNSTLPFSVVLGGGAPQLNTTFETTVVGWLRDKLISYAQKMLQEFASDLEQDLMARFEAALAQHVGQLTLPLFGGTGVITRAGIHDDRLVIDLDLNFSGTKIVVRDAALVVDGIKDTLQQRLDAGPYSVADVTADLSAAIQSGKVKVDLRQVTMDGADDVLGTLDVSKLLDGANLDSEWVTYIGYQVLPEQQAIAFDFHVTLESLDVDLPAIRILLMPTGVKIATTDGHPEAFAASLLVEILKSKLGERLAGKEVLIGDIGSIRIHEQDPISTLTLDGTLALTLNVTFSLQGYDVDGTVSLPSMNVTMNKDQFKAIINALLRLGGPAGITITQFDSIPTPPGYVLGASFKCGGSFTLGFKGARITTKKIEMPSVIEGTYNYPIPFGTTGFWLVNPRVRLYPKEVTTIGVGADMTYGSPPVQYIIKFAIDLDANLKELVFTVNGRLVLVTFLPLYEIVGVLDVTKTEMHVNGRTVGPVRNVVKSDSEVYVNAKAAFAEAHSKLEVFGVDMLNVDITIKALETVKASGMAKLPLQETTFEVDLDPRKGLNGISGKAKIDWGPAGMSSIHLGVEPGWAEAGFEYFGIPVTVVKPGPLEITPDAILDAIKNLLNFDPTRLLKIKELPREIVISCQNSAGDSVKASIGKGSGTSQKSPDGESASGANGSNSVSGNSGGGGEHTPSQSKADGAAASGDAPPAREQKGASSNEVPSIKQGQWSVVFEAVDNQQYKQKVVGDFDTGRTEYYRPLRASENFKRSFKDEHFLEYYWDWIVVPETLGRQIAPEYEPWFRYVDYRVALDPASKRLKVCIEGGKADTAANGDILSIDEDFMKRLLEESQRGPDELPELLEEESPLNSAQWSLLRKCVRSSVRTALAEPQDPNVQSLYDVNILHTGLLSPAGGGTKRWVYIYRLDYWPAAHSPKGADSVIALQFADESIPFESVGEQSPFFPLLNGNNDNVRQSIARVLMAVAERKGRLGLLWRAANDDTFLFWIEKPDSQDYEEVFSVTNVESAGNVSQLKSIKWYGEQLEGASINAAKLKKGDPFGIFLQHALAKGWDELHTSDGVDSEVTVLAKGMATGADGDWSLACLLRQDASQTLKEKLDNWTAKQLGSGQAILAKYKEWKSGNVVKHPERYGSLTDEQQRRNLLRVLVRPGEGWREDFWANPRGLVLPQ